MLCVCVWVWVVWDGFQLSASLWRSRWPVKMKILLSKWSPVLAYFVSVEWVTLLFLQGPISESVYKLQVVLQVHNSGSSFGGLYPAQARGLIQSTPKLSVHIPHEVLFEHMWSYARSLVFRLWRTLFLCSIRRSNDEKPNVHLDRSRRSKWKWNVSCSDFGFSK